MNGLFAVQEGHARADVGDDLAGLLFRKGALTVAQIRLEVSPRHKLHDEDQSVFWGGDCSVDVDGMRTAEADHRVELADKGFSPALFPLSLDLSLR